MSNQAKRRSNSFARPLYLAFRCRGISFSFPAVCRMVRLRKFVATRSVILFSPVPEHPSAYTVFYEIIVYNNYIWKLSMICSEVTDDTRSLAAVPSSMHVATLSRFPPIRAHISKFTMIIGSNTCRYCRCLLAFARRMYEGNERNGLSLCT